MVTAVVVKSWMSTAYLETKDGGFLGERGDTWLRHQSGNRPGWVGGEFVVHRFSLETRQIVDTSLMATAAGSLRSGAAVRDGTLTKNATSSTSWT